MKLTLSDASLEKMFSRLAQTAIPNQQPAAAGTRAPVHVVYGGAHLFKSGTPQKLGKLALDALNSYAANFVEFANAMWLKGADTLPRFSDVIENLENQLTENAGKAQDENYDAWFAWTVFQRVREKLQTQAVEDFRIDFEDGYGFRPDAEEDAHAVAASDELAASVLQKTVTPFCGFRIKSLAPETQRRAVRTLDLFLTNFLEKTGGRVPENFAVTLPKITRAEEVKVLAELLAEFEKQNDLAENSFAIEIMIETPQAIFNEAGELVLRELVEAGGGGRVNSAHFGAYDYTSAFGIVAEHQHLRHEACNFARQMMQLALAPMGIRLSDSVTTEMPVPVHKGDNLTGKQIAENKRAIHKAWRAHFNNVTHSLINGFYQSWDLHPAQLAARYAAVYAFFLESKESSARRLKNFIDKATQAMLTGNQFDDAASAQGLLNFFVRAANCGALSESEVLEATNLSLEELRAASFARIMESRRAS